MTLLAFFLSFTLVALAALHLLWAIGYWFPLAQEAALARAVVGREGMTRMPGALPCALVVVALLFAAAWPWLAPGPLRTAGLGGLAGLFALRGAASHLPGFRRRHAAEPFATLDRRAYGPLSLALGAGFLSLTIGALT